MAESHQDRVDRIFNSVKKKARKEVRKARKAPNRSKPQASTRKPFGKALKAIRERHKRLGDM